MRRCRLDVRPLTRSSTEQTSVTRSSPDAGTATELAVPLPHRHHGRGTASTNTQGFVFGGYDWVTGTFYDTIMRFTP